MGLGENIRTLRKARKLSQDYLAEQLNVSRQAVSKWENGQSEPNSRNLAELANLLEVSVSELVGQVPPSEPEKNREKERKKQLFSCIAIGAYTAFVIMSTIETNDPGFYVFTSVLILLAAIVMAVNIARLPAEVRRKTALKELGYCGLLYCLVTFVEPRIGNVYTAVLICICSMLYAKYIRFPHRAN